MTFSLTPTSHYRTTQPLLYIYSTPIPAQTTIVQRATSITQSPTSPPLRSISCTKTGCLPLYTEAPLRPQPPLHSFTL